MHDGPQRITSGNSVNTSEGAMHVVYNDHSNDDSSESYSAAGGLILPPRDEPIVLDTAGSRLSWEDSVHSVVSRAASIRTDSLLSFNITHRCIESTVECTRAQ